MVIGWEPITLIDLVWALWVGAGLMFMVAGTFLAIMVVDISMVRMEIACMTEGGCCKRRRQIVTIEIVDSPEPTRHPCSPFPPTPTPKRRPARRAGAARIVAHTRRFTKIVDPRKKGHCGYVCVLQACGEKPTPEKIKELRKMTACIVGNYIVQDGVLGGHRAKHLPVESGQSYHAYLADVRAEQWASTAELEAACMAKNIQLQVHDGIRVMTLNEGAQHRPYCIRMRHEHYTLWRMSRRRTGETKKGEGMEKNYADAKGLYHDEQDKKEHVQRAGMLPPPPWRLGSNLHEDHVIIDVNPPFPCAPPRITVFTDYEISRSIRGMTMLVMKPVNVAGLRRFLTGAFDLIPGSFVLRLPGDGQREIQDHEEIPTMIVMEGGDRRRDTTVRIHMENGATFMMEFVETDNHLGFLQLRE